MTPARLRRALASAFALSLVTAFGVTALDAPASAAASKVLFCHATGSASNPWVRINTSVNAFFNAGHVDHPDDVFPPVSSPKFSTPGQGLHGAFTADDQAFIDNGCAAPATAPAAVPVPDPTPSPESSTADPTPTPEPALTPDVAPTPEPAAPGVPDVAVFFTDCSTADGTGTVQIQVVDDAGFGIVVTLDGAAVADVASIPVHVPGTHTVVVTFTSDDASVQVPQPLTFTYDFGSCPAPGASPSPTASDPAAIVPLAAEDPLPSDPASPSADPSDPAAPAADVVPAAAAAADPATPSASPSSSPRVVADGTDRLAMTGAQVGGLVFGGVVLVALGTGLVLLSRRRAAMRG